MNCREGAEFPATNRRVWAWERRIYRWRKRKEERRVGSGEVLRGAGDDGTPRRFRMYYMGFLYSTAVKLQKLAADDDYKKVVHQIVDLLYHSVVFRGHLGTL